MRIQGSKRQIFRERNEAVIKYNDLRKAAEETNQAVEAILAAVVRAYADEEGKVVIDMPRVKRGKQVMAEKTEDGKMVIRLRSENETERSDP